MISENREKIIFKAFRLNLFDGIIESITKVNTNLFSITTYAFYGKDKPKTKVIEALIKIGFCESKDDVEIVSQYYSKLDTWNCLIIEVKFKNWRYKIY